jgi:predicted transcriptional regulator
VWQWEEVQELPHEASRLFGALVLTKYLPDQYQMKTAKEEVKRLLEGLSDDASFEEIQYQIYVCQKIERGLDDIEKGNVLTHDDVQNRISRWREK